MSRYLRRGNRLLKEVRIELRADSQAPGGAAPVCQGHLICDLTKKGPWYFAC